jgi:hypothetical protein
MTKQNRGGDDSSRRTQRGNSGNQEARDLGEVGRYEDEADNEPGATGDRDRQGQGGARGDRGVGNNTDGVIGSGGETPGGRDR